MNGRAAARRPTPPTPPLARRLVAEPPSPTRTEFQRDRDRIVHSTAFRRLAHKTQVFVHHEGDHFRTRLTHTIEVAQIARALARALEIDDDLAEAVALAHDLGHTPFGHTGEEALDACMAGDGGFDHNSHALRIVTELERHYADFDGLNLTRHDARRHRQAQRAAHRRCRAAVRALPRARPARWNLAYDRRQPLDLSRYASLEAQAAALADDIAYDAHDIDDGLRAGLFPLSDICAAVPFVAAVVAEIEDRHPGLETGRLIHELTRRVITRFIEDAIAESRRRIETAGVAQPRGGRVRPDGRSSPTRRRSRRPTATSRRSSSPACTAILRCRRVRDKADAILRRLFAAFIADPSLMPPVWAAKAEGAERARAVADYIAGMTDRFAIHEHARLFDGPRDLR